MMQVNEVGVGMGTMQILTDYQLESWIRSSSPEGCSDRSDEPGWKQLTQYAAYHAINDWYSMPAALRTCEYLTKQFEGRWTNKCRKFESKAFYMDVKARVLAHLYDQLTDENAVQRPIMLFESSDVWVEELELGLSMIVQVMACEQGSFVVHKYVMEDNEAAAQLFGHMTVVFCHKAFGRLPERLELFNMLNGKQYRIGMEEMDVGKSMDYLRLVKDVYMETNKGCPCCSSRLVM
ncbi:hypothetical protein [Bacillus sp. 3255]|uniref:hypothetical protein n=1 Tax=Bacillus sp. 3255 TaxID=2817904 RepID=UPI002856C6EA|nr:hypothetical protein [Bacillus sp. 3255]MDR6884808.1 hypothetical protein [Bacillus sp. 3255]